jgi:hypothetical protein
LYINKAQSEQLGSLCKPAENIIPTALSFLTNKMVHGGEGGDTASFIEHGVPGLLAGLEDILVERFNSTHVSSCILCNRAASAAAGEITDERGLRKVP